MGWPIVKQPDGNYACFDGVVDDFVMWGADQIESVRYCVERRNLSVADAGEHVQRGIDDLKPWTITPGSGLDRWKGALGSLVFRHGEQALRSRLEEMGFADYPVEEIILDHCREPLESGNHGP